MKQINKKLIILTIILLIIVISLSGCKKVVKSESKEVEVTITNQYHRGMYMNMIKSGKTMIPINYPAVYHIYVTYNKVEYCISGSDTYDKFKDKIGEKTKAILITNTYDDGTIAYEIEKLIN